MWFRQLFVLCVQTVGQRAGKHRLAAVTAAGPQSRLPLSVCGWAVRRLSFVPREWNCLHSFLRFPVPPGAEDGETTVCLTLSNHLPIPTFSSPTKTLPFLSECSATPILSTDVKSFSFGCQHVLEVGSDADPVRPLHAKRSAGAGQHGVSGPLSLFPGAAALHRRWW